MAEGRSQEEEMDMIIEFPLAVVVDNLMQVRRDNPTMWAGGEDRARTRIERKRDFRLWLRCDGEFCVMSAAYLCEVSKGDCKGKGIPSHG